MARAVTDLTIRPLTGEHWPALEELFGAAGASNGCWCMYWRIGPRYKDRLRDDNKGDLRRLAGSGQPPGLLAFDGQVPAGWCELAPRSDLGWLAHARYLEPADDLPVWSVPCFYIRRSHRRQGVMGALIAAAVTAAAAAGAPALEAYPVDTAVPGHTGNLFPGTVPAFARHGFEVVARRKPDRPVMRRTFSGDEKSLAGSSLPVPGHREENIMTEQSPPWPKQGPPSYFPSIEKKYGRSIAEWQQVIASCGLDKHMAIVGYLKTEHGMGHGHANALVGWTLAGNVARP